MSTPSQNDHSGTTKCIKCGADIRASAKFCPNCGAAQASQPLDAVAPVMPSEEPSLRPEAIALSPDDEGLQHSSPPESKAERATPKGGRIPLPLLILGGLVVVVVLIMIVRNSKSPQPNQSATENSPQSAAPPSRIITKDPEWARLLHPPTGEDDILVNSQAYVQKKQEIEAKLSQVSDPELRERVSSEEWGKVDKQSYMAEGEENLRASVAAAMNSFLDRHRTDLFEIGHVNYPGSGSLLVKSVDASPLEVPDGEIIPLDISTMDSVYSKFREAAKPAIQAGVENWMYEQTCNAHLKNACENLGGSPGECSDPEKLREIEQQLGSGGILIGCNDNPSAETGWGIIEKQVRESRLVLVGQGDLPNHRIDKLLLVDYDTESVLLELPSSAMTGVLRWKAPLDSLSPKPSASEVSSTGPDASSDAQLPLHQQSDDEQAVREAVEGWANAFRARDADRLAAYYAQEVEQFFRKKDVSRPWIQETFQSTFGKMDSINAYEISDLRVEFPGVSTSTPRATATYDKTWDTSQTNGKRNSGEEIERLTFEKTDDGWKIVREDEIQIIRALKQ